MTSMTERVQVSEQLPVRRRRHHRRSPAKRFLLSAGPFFLLTGAFLLSVGVVEIVEKPPASGSRPTLAQERAETAAEAPAGDSVRPSSPHVWRIESLPTALTADDYEVRQRAAASSATEQEPLDATGSLDHLGFRISQRARAILGR